MKLYKNCTLFGSGWITNCLQINTFGPTNPIRMRVRQLQHRRNIGVDSLTQSQSASSSFRLITRYVHYMYTTCTLLVHYMYTPVSQISLDTITWFLILTSPTKFRRFESCILFRFAVFSWQGYW